MLARQVAVVDAVLIRLRHQICIGDEVSARPDTLPGGGVVETGSKAVKSIVDDVDAF
jgi:hypothetical protein